MYQKGQGGKKVISTQSCYFKLNFTAVPPVLQCCKAQTKGGGWWAEHCRWTLMALQGWSFAVILTFFFFFCAIEGAPSS